MRILILHTELSGYFIRCVEELVRVYSPELKLVHWPMALSAPFDMDCRQMEVIARAELADKSLVESIVQWDPKLVLVAGWNDGLYRQMARRLKGRGATVICGLDNPWKGNLRQRLACVVAPWLLGWAYTHMWVAGYRQWEFARRLGWPNHRIMPGLYSADVDLFGKCEVNTSERRLVYVGRMEPGKGIDLLYRAFSMLSEVERKGWVLYCVGNGSLAGDLPSTQHIEVTSFRQPKDLVRLLPTFGGFILPSRYEPWGVVVHEFAAAGKPLLVSSAVNAGEEFVVPGYNGFVFQADSLLSLKQALILFFSVSDADRQAMGERSRELSRRNSPRLWAARLMSQVE